MQPGDNLNLDTINSALWTIRLQKNMDNSPKVGDIRMEAKWWHRAREKKGIRLVKRVYLMERLGNATLLRTINFIAGHLY